MSVAKIPPLTGRILVQFDGKDPIEAGTFTIPVPTSPAFDADEVSVVPNVDLREEMAAGFEQLAAAMRE